MQGMGRRTDGARLPRMKACDSSGTSFRWGWRPKQWEVSICPNIFPTIKSSKFPASTATRRRPKRLLGSAQMIATTALDATPRSLLSEMRCLRELA
jgi:hypothetical protein